MKFKDLTYTRPDMVSIENVYNESVDVVMNSNNVNDVYLAIDRCNEKRKLFQTMESICMIRYTINTGDEFYKKETDFFDENTPIYTELENRLSKALAYSPFKEQLKAKYGEQLFNLIDVQLESFSKEIIPLLQKESKLVTEHQSLIGQAKIEFRGKVLNLSQMGPYLIELDRNTRIEAETTLWKWFEDNIDSFDRIYDELVKVRNEMAITLGYDNYVDLGYKRLSRTDYTKEDVRKYRKQVLEEIVPIAEKIYKLQQERLGLSDFKSYDVGLKFLSGNPKPIGDLDYKVNQARKMYHEMSEETKEFVDFMLDNEMIDLLAKPGKNGGGYCTSIPLYKTPFVFANFNGTSHDVDVLTHEFGHAFQSYCCRDFEVLEYQWPTLESCEIHSMSMEFFSWKWMNLFFGNDEDKYKYLHLCDSITFIPYGVLVDEFQEWVYLNPTKSQDERKKVWRELEKKYMPWLVYDNEFLEKGNYWIRQSHIFSTAFYYIDYTLAQNCAHQFFVKNMTDPKKAWNDYLTLCKAGGSKSFLKLLDVGNLDSPFVEGTISKVMKPINKWLDDFDFSKIK